jgi:hypothetical protein
MNKAELWDELKMYLIKAIPALYKNAEGILGDGYEELRIKAKVSGMALVLQKMEEFECSLFDN